MWPFVILGAVVVVAGAVLVAVVWEDRRGGRATSGRKAPWRSRRRAVAATLEVATARSTPPVSSARPSEQGDFVERIFGPRPPPWGPWRPG